MMSANDSWSVAFISRQQGHNVPQEIYTWVKEHEEHPLPPVHRIDCFRELCTAAFIDTASIDP